jgi:hypothetical protein
MYELPLIIIARETAAVKKKPRPKPLKLYNLPQENAAEKREKEAPRAPFPTPNRPLLSKKRLDLAEGRRVGQPQIPAANISNLDSTFFAASRPRLAVEGAILYSFGDVARRPPHP